LRTFIAVRIAPTFELRQLHAKLAELGGRFRPVSLENLHLTLKFLGETEPSQISAISSIVRLVAREQPATAQHSIHVHLVGLGAFPHERRPAIVWVGFQQAESLCQLATELDRGLAPLGFAPEGKQFQPHLTLLRVKSRPPEALFAILAEEAQTDFGMVEISHVELIESELTPRGSRYTTLAKFSLGVTKEGA
jgi:2'-5' RNA ligase